MASSPFHHVKPIEYLSDGPYDDNRLHELREYIRQWNLIGVPVGCSACDGELWLCEDPNEVGTFHVKVRHEPGCQKVLRGHS